MAQRPGDAKSRENTHILILLCLELSLTDFSRDKLLKATYICTLQEKQKKSQGNVKEQFPIKGNKAFPRDAVAGYSCLRAGVCVQERE